MNIEHKKTALDDDAYIYTRNRDETNKETVKNLTRKQKLTYFKDYYSVKVLVGIILVVMICSLLNQTVFNRSSCLLSIACVDDRQIIKAEEMGVALEEYLPIEGKNDYASVSYYDRDDAQMNMAYVTHYATGSIDLIICSEDYFKEASAQGMFADLNTFLTDENKALLSDRFLNAQIAQTDDDGAVIGYEDEAPYGIDISDSEIYREYDGIGDKVILCVHVNAGNKENAQKAISFFFEEK